MKRGRLRVLLGAAPGVGKTYEMLEEGRRLRDSGRDVVIGVVETHDRAATAALVEGLPIVPRRVVAHRGVELTEMDVDAVLERHPELALVDELAHTNAPGSRNRQALAGRAGAAGCRHRRDHDGERAAHRVAERRRRADHRRRPARDGAGCRGPRRRRDRGRRPRPAVAARPARRPESSIPPSGSMRRCRTTSGSATSPRCANSPCCGSPTRSTARSTVYRAEHGIHGHVAGPRTRRRGADRRPGRRDAHPPRRPHRRPVGRR